MLPLLVGAVPPPVLTAATERSVGGTIRPLRAEDRHELSVLPVSRVFPHSTPVNPV